MQEVTVNMEEDGYVVKDDDWEFWGVAKHQHDNSDAIFGTIVAVRVEEQETHLQTNP
jgi:hypothetical protein